MIYLQWNLLVPLSIKAAYFLMFHVIISFDPRDHCLGFMWSLHWFHVIISCTFIWALESIHPRKVLEIAPKIILLLTVNSSFGFQHFVVFRRGFYKEILGVLRVLVCYSNAQTFVDFNGLLKWICARFCACLSFGWCLSVGVLERYATKGCWKRMVLVVKIWR